MSREVSVNCSLTVVKRSGSLVLINEKRGATFTDDLLATTAKGPTPGAFSVPTTGVDVALSQLDSPGWCWIANLGSTYTIEYGIHDGAVFHPFGELPPGCGHPFKFSTNLGQEHVAAGTGTSGDVNTFHMKTYGGTSVGYVGAFER